MNTYLSDFGTLNLDINGSCAYGEAIFYFLKSLATLFELELKDLPRIDLIATLLLSAISLKTDYFASAKMKADSFLAVAELLKFGARRLDLSEKQQLSEKKEKSVVVKKAKSKK